MMAWVPAITHLSPMDTVLAVHHRRNVGCFHFAQIINQRFKRNWFIKMSIRSDPVDYLFFCYILSHSCHRPFVLHSCKSRWRPAFLRAPIGIHRADSRRYCPANTCSLCSEPPAQRRRLGYVQGSKAHHPTLVHMHHQGCLFDSAYTPLAVRAASSPTPVRCIQPLLKPQRLSSPAA